MAIMAITVRKIVMVYNVILAMGTNAKEIKNL
jgi:hypothetical protein